jgi:hypothetical protein
MPGGWRVIDVWQSRAAFNRFGKTLGPILKKARDSRAETKNFPGCKIYQILAIASLERAGDDGRTPLHPTWPSGVMEGAQRCSD